MDPGTEHVRIMLDADLYLQTLGPDHAPVGLLELIKAATQRVLDLGCFSLNGF